MAAIKADGYGHGLVRTARALDQADAFAVASVGEALSLREAGIQTPVTLLEGFFHADELAPIQRLGFMTVVHQWAQVDMLEQADLSAPVKVWIKVDSGMHRLGFLPQEVRTAFDRLGRVPHVQLLGFVTHLARADERDHPATQRQIDTFTAAVEGLPGERSIGNSAGLLAWPAARSAWVRPGIMLYGASPFPGRTAADEGLQPVMTVRSELIAVHDFNCGDPIGYGGSWSCPEAMRVGVAAIGYGDGYPRHARSGTPVLLNGRRVPLVGRVSMDMITLDLRTQPDARVGDPVVLWGEGLPVEEIAEQAGTISYELLCGITARVPRVELA
jgi:alanine racemase